ncbi:MAG: glycosyltransferase family 9 protein, partial [Nitrospirota bacterium]|nr:glycosyltransferase family 9 protein [Nitrospirota bacterium]
LGDVVKCTALPRLIKRIYPHAQITFLTSESHLELVRDNPHVHRAIGFERHTGLGGLLALARELAAERFHLVVDVHRSLRSRLLTGLIPAPRTRYSKRTLQRALLIHFGLNTYRPDATGHMPGKEDDFLAGLRPYGVVDDGLGTEFNLAPLEGPPPLNGRLPAERKQVERWQTEGRPLLGVAPVAAWPLKRWPLTQWRALLTGVLETTAAGVLLFGGPGDVDILALGDDLAAQPSGQGRILALAGRTTLPESAWFAARCRVMLTHDTGMSHLAEAVGREALVLFGPTSRELGYFPVRPGSRVLERPLSCRPCTRTGQGDCRHPWPQACLDALDPQDVLAVVRDILGPG